MNARKSGEESTEEQVFDMCAYMEFQINEIQKHKYLESEKAGRDLGQEAVCDWIKRYARGVREWAIESGKFTKPKRFTRLEC